MDTTDSMTGYLPVQTRRATHGSGFRWSRMPLESGSCVSGVEYRLFQETADGNLLREHLVFTAPKTRAAVAAGLVKARKRLRAEYCA